MRNAYGVRVYHDSREKLRWSWKIRRDTAKRGYTEEEVLRELATREQDSARYIRPQRDHADVVVSFFPGESYHFEGDGDAHLNVRLTLHGTLHHPDLSEVIAEHQSGYFHSTRARQSGRAVEYLEIDGSYPDEPARALERCILDHLDACGASSPADLGQYSDSQTRDSRHSHPLALTQLLLVYHLLPPNQLHPVMQQSRIYS